MIEICAGGTDLKLTVLSFGTVVIGGSPHDAHNCPGAKGWRVRCGEQEATPALGALIILAARRDHCHDQGSDDVLLGLSFL